MSQKPSKSTSHESIPIGDFVSPRAICLHGDQRRIHRRAVLQSSSNDRDSFSSSFRRRGNSRTRWFGKLQLAMISVFLSALCLSHPLFSIQLQNA